jgi:Carboxypeptidase regulatory-like domain
MRVVRYEPSRALAEGEFRLELPPNADVTDLALGTGYCNDPWWPEIGKLLRDRFDWPKVDVSRLSELATYGTPEIIGRPAPPMEASLWINSEPLDLRKLRGKVVTATSGPDGNFIVVGLCKGNYALRVAAPDLAVVDRHALITHALGPASIQVVLGQSDTITGLVVDEAGKPVAGAETILSERRLLHADGTETHFNGFFEGKVTDGDGRFRFGGLSEGSFTLRVKGEGFTEEKRENVPAGTTDLKLVLRRPGRRQDR